MQGHSTDFVVTADGAVMHGLALICILRDAAGINTFKVIQETRSLQRVLLVIEGGGANSSVDQIIGDSKNRLDESIAAKVDLVNSIPSERSSKFRYIVSHA